MAGEPEGASCPRSGGDAETKVNQVPSKASSGDLESGWTRRERFAAASGRLQAPLTLRKRVTTFVIGAAMVTLPLLAPVVAVSSSWSQGKVRYGGVQGCDVLKYLDGEVEDHVVSMLYHDRLLIACMCSVVVALLTWWGLRHSSSPSAYVQKVKRWLFLNWLVAVLWCSDRVCPWCMGEGTEMLRVVCGYLWMFREIFWGASGVKFSQLLRMRVSAIEQATMTTPRHTRYISSIIWAQVALLVVISGFGVARPWALEGRGFRIDAAREVLLSLLMLLVVASLVITLHAFIGPLQAARQVAHKTIGRQRTQAWAAVKRGEVHLGVTAACVVTRSVITMGFDFYSEMLWDFQPGMTSPPYEFTKNIIFGLDLIMSALGQLMLSGLVEVPLSSGSSASLSQRSLCRSASGDLAWDAKVHELAHRSISLEAILTFYAGLGTEYMPHFDPDKHTTGDVVRQAIIPLTANTPWGPCALATKLMQGSCAPAQRMVTHAWSNTFAHLVSAIVAEALGQPTYEGMEDRLTPEGLPQLVEELRHREALQVRYWVCAMSINQHAGICGTDPSKGKDPVTGLEHPLCSCGHQKYWNDTPPQRSDGEGVFCEINKFDDMMALLAVEVPDFRQVVAVDASFDLFGRAWCVAEIFLAHTGQIDQEMVVHSRATVDAHRASLESLRVEDMEAARPEDKAMILSKIGNRSQFNRSLRWMVLDDKEGLLAGWRDAVAEAEALGRIARSRRRTRTITR